MKILKLLLVLSIFCITLFAECIVKAMDDYEKPLFYGYREQRTQKERTLKERTQKSKRK